MADVFQLFKGTCIPVPSQIFDSTACMLGSGRAYLSSWQMRRTIRYEWDLARTHSGSHGGYGSCRFWLRSVVRWLTRGKAVRGRLTHGRFEAQLKGPEFSMQIRQHRDGAAWFVKIFRQEMSNFKEEPDRLKCRRVLERSGKQRYRCSGVNGNEPGSSLRQDQMV